MKHLIARTLTVLMLVTLGMTMMAQAQSAPAIRVNVPFEFNFGQQTFPAGNYSVSQPIQHMVVLQDYRGYTVAQAITEGVESLNPAAATKLLFESSEGQHILREVWQEGETSGTRFYPDSDSANLAKHRSTEARETAEGSRP